MKDQSHKFDTKKSWIFFFKSSNPFEFYHILNGIDLEPNKDIYGTLIFPENTKLPCPLVIAIHGSVGLRGNHHDHMVNLLEAGIAIFRIHSFYSILTTSDPVWVWNVLSKKNEFWDPPPRILTQNRVESRQNWEIF